MGLREHTDPDGSGTKNGWLWFESADQARRLLPGPVTGRNAPPPISPGRVPRGSGALAPPV